MSEMIDVVVDGIVFATLDPVDLKGRAQIDLEEARGALDILRWCRNHGGVSEEQSTKLKEVLADMPLQSTVELTRAIGAALARAVSIPKANGRL